MRFWFNNSPKMNKPLNILLIIVFAICFIDQCKGQNEGPSAADEGEEEGHAQLRPGERCPARDRPTQKCSRKTSCEEGFFCKVFRRSSGDNIRFCCRKRETNGGEAGGKAQKYREKMDKAKAKKQKQKDKLRALKRRREEGGMDEEQYREKKRKYKRKKDSAKQKARKNKQKLGMANGREDE